MYPNLKERAIAAFMPFTTTYLWYVDTPCDEQRSQPAVVYLRYINSEYKLFANWDSVREIKKFSMCSILQVSSSRSLTESMFEEVSPFLNRDRMFYPIVDHDCGLAVL